MLRNLSLNWDLDAFFPGGSNSQELQEYLSALEQDVQELRQEAATAPASNDDWARLLERIEDLSTRMRHAGSFVGCLNAQNYRDRRARLLAGRIRQIGAVVSAVHNKLNQYMLAVPDNEWTELLTDERFQAVAYNLNEMRERAKAKLPVEQEDLITNLSVDGYHAWNNLYNLAVSQIRIPVEEDGRTVELSAAQASNRMSSSNRKVRQEVFSKWEQAWSEVEDFCAAALNHLAGFRLSVYRARGWNDVLQEPLELNRMTRQTLDTMWDTINANKDKLITFMQRKKQLLETEQLSWHDVTAPLGSSNRKIAFDEAANFVVEQVSRFSPKMADLFTRAFRERWVEAEDRPGKRPGAFCTSSPVLKQSRVFMTFSGTMNNVFTLAHELGHAFHQSVMNDLPPLAQRYAMNVAETASTFSEMVVLDAALKQASSPSEKIALLNDKLQRSVSLLMNIHARFLFETRFYAERKSGLVSVERLNQLMTEAQQEAYCGALDEYHPRFWASKLHFYNTGVPFYNFPYTFGYLFSAGIYSRALEEGRSFEEKYVALLRDTGRMRVEDLAAKHLGIDLQQPDFWQQALDAVLADLDEFLRLTQ